METSDERLLQPRAFVICVILHWTKRTMYQCMPMLLDGRNCSFSLMEKTLDGPNVADIAREP